MLAVRFTPMPRRVVLMVAPIAAALLASCGGTGTERDSGGTKTYLSVEATDADGDALQYQWRVTSGTVENRNAKSTVWTMPDGPGLHFAYVSVSDGKGGYIEQQYAVSSDTLGTTAPVRAPTSHTAQPATDTPAGATARLRFISGDNTRFATAGTTVPRYVYLPDVQVRVTRKSTGLLIFSGVSDLSGEVKLPKLEVDPPGSLNPGYQVCYATAPDVPLTECVTIAGAEQVLRAQDVRPPLSVGRNLRLYGHIALADGGVCGMQNEYFAIQSAATVQLMQDDGTALSNPIHVNRFGDYALDAAVAVDASLKLAVRCEGYQAEFAVPTRSAGYKADDPVELSRPLLNARPVFVKMVATGPDGNVRGKMIVAETGASSNAQPGSDHFLSYKGLDTKLGACMYYRALGAVASCDAQGNMVDPISLDDWRRLNGFGIGGVEVAANYINKRDLNLVRQMRATKTATDHIAFYVCNHPGPVGTSQKEIDEVLETALNGEKLVACVAMEWSVTPGVNGDAPFTKFFTFSPTGELLASVNLDGRGEKYLPGTCVACHGGNKYNGKFPEKGDASANLGSNFLPFDTGNYFFGSAASLGEAAQSRSLFELNKLVRDTEFIAPGAAASTTATAKLINGWYHDDTRTTLDADYVPTAWTNLGGDAPKFYKRVVGTACRTCHTSLGADFDWDTRAATLTSSGFAETRFCGGNADVAINASMPNALITHDRLFEQARSDAELAGLLQTFLGCSAPRPDPAYPKR